MWSPATWTWRAALTCVLLETVLHGVRGRWEKTRCFYNQSCAGTTRKQTNAMDMLAGTDVLCQQNSVYHHRVGSAGSGSTLAVVAPHSCID